VLSFTVARGWIIQVDVIADPARLEQLDLSALELAPKDRPRRPGDHRSVPAARIGGSNRATDDSMSFQKKNATCLFSIAGHNVRW
jgi:hypothetical protein